MPLPIPKLVLYAECWNPFPYDTIKSLLDNLKLGKAFTVFSLQK